MLCDRGLVNGAGVIIKASRDGQVDREISVRNAEVRDVLNHLLQLLNAGPENSVLCLGRSVVRKQSLELVNGLGLGALKGQESEQLSCDSLFDSELCKLSLYIVKADLVELVYDP